MNYKPFKCDICDYICSFKSNLKRHIDSVHGNKEPCKCDICGYSYFQKGDLKKHIESVHQEKKFVKKLSIKRPE